MFIVDAHLDLAYNALRGRAIRHLAREQTPSHNEIPTVGLPDLRAAGVGLICATIFTMPRATRNNALGAGFSTFAEAKTIALQQIDEYRLLEREGFLRLVTSRNQLPGKIDANPTRPIPAILLMENADPIQSPADVQFWFDAGVRIVGLAWRKSRYAGGTNYPGPLKDAGREIAKSFDQIGMIHDASHLSEESFWELLDLTTGPLMASHSNCRAISPSDRQLSDAMIRAIVKRKGVIGINLYDEFLLPASDFKKRRATIADVVAHIDRICAIAGNAAHVALGTDLDGGVGRADIPVELETAQDLPKIADALSAAGYSDDDVRRIMGSNWTDFFRRTLPAN
jgi:membrane dipeptidase